MVFVNEYISDEDREKYNIDEINKKFIVGGTNARHWTIDKSRNIYLRNVARGREEFFHISTWTFFWEGELLVFDVEIVDASGGIGEPGWSHKKISQLDIPEKMRTKKEKILFDLKEAFLAYKDGGVFAKSTTYTLQLDFE